MRERIWLHGWVAGRVLGSGFKKEERGKGSLEKIKIWRDRRKKAKSEWKIGGIRWMREKGSGKVK